jgi:hypothetical protein
MHLFPEIFKEYLYWGGAQGSLGIKGLTLVYGCMSIYFCVHLSIIVGVCVCVCARVCVRVCVHC